MKTNDIRFIDYQTGQKDQEKKSTDWDRWVVYNGSKVVVYNGSKVHEPRS